MKKIILLMIILGCLVGCSGERIGDDFETEEQICTTTMEYKWVWSIFEESGFRKVPVTTCKNK